MNVDAARDEYDLRCVSAGGQPLDTRDGSGEARSGSNALMCCGGCTIDRDLHTLRRECNQAVGGGIVDVAAVGFELEATPARASRSNMSQQCGTPSGSLRRTQHTESPMSQFAARRSAPLPAKARRSTFYRDPTPRSRQGNGRRSDSSAARRRRAVPCTPRPNGRPRTRFAISQVKRIYG